MTQDEVIEMAQECKLIGMRPFIDGIYTEALIEFAKLVAAKAIAELESQEPVAWAHYDTFKNLDSLITARFRATLATKKSSACCIALYTHPPQRTKEKNT
jgi:hypothetical protein